MTLTEIRSLWDLPEIWDFFRGIHIHTSQHVRESFPCKDMNVSKAVRDERVFKKMKKEAPQILRRKIGTWWPVMNPDGWESFRRKNEAWSLKKAKLDGHDGWTNVWGEMCDDTVDGRNPAITTWDV